MAGLPKSLTPRRVGALVLVVVVAVAAAVGVTALTSSSPSPSASHASHANHELQGYSFVYHPGSNVTVVKQSFTTNMSQLTLSGPSGSVGWENASGGANNMVGLFDYRTVGAKPGDTLVVKKRLTGGSTVLSEGNSTVPPHPTPGGFLAFYHQKPAVTVVNVNVTGTSNLELVGPHGSVAWANATLGSSPTAATFAYNRHALGATAGDNVSLVRISGGSRTTLLKTEIP